MRKVGAWVIAVFVLLVGCGPRQVDSAGSSSPAPSTTTATTTRTPAVIGHDGGPGEAAPHESENNGWKYPGALPADAQKQAEAAADRIRPALEKLRTANRFGTDAVRSALTGVGFRAQDIEVREFDQPPGVVYGVAVGSGCVQGDVRPERVQAEAAAPLAEWGCLPPGKTH